MSFERQLSSVKRNAFWIRVDYYPDRGQRGDVRGVLATYTDVDTIKRLELEAGEREHRLRIVTDSVGLPIFYFDRALRLRFANKPYGKYIGGPVDDILGQPLKNFVAPDALAEMQGYMERAFAGATVSYDRRERSSSGELRWVRITLFPDREPGGKTGGAFVVINDIEDDVRIREALKAQERSCASSPTTSGTDRLSRQAVEVQLRQPGLRQLGVQAAGPDLRQDAVRGHAARRQLLPAAHHQARARR